MKHANSHNLYEFLPYTRCDYIRDDKEENVYVSNKLFQGIFPRFSHVIHSLRTAAQSVPLLMSNSRYN